MTPNRSTTRPPQALPFSEGNRHAELVALLGFKKVSGHIDDLGLFYLIGCAYHDGARSLRRIAEMLRAPRAGLLAEELARKVGEDLPKSLRAIHKAVAMVEDLAGEQLVNRTGEGLGYDGLTGAGERFWGLVATFVREFWA